MMKTLICGLTILCSGALAAAESTEQTIVAMERQAMDGWRDGNPDRFLAISDPEITLIHSALGKRLVGLEAVRAVYEGYRGRPLFDRYEMAEPRVVVSGKVAVLSYLFTTVNGSLTRQWHATEVYRKGKSGWRILHSHFSQVQS